MDCTSYVTSAKTKALISCAVTTRLICVFVFAKSRFSHAVAHIHFNSKNSTTYRTFFTSWSFVVAGYVTGTLTTLAGSYVITQLKHKIRAITKTSPCNIQRFFTAVKMTIFSQIFFHIFAQNIDCWYTLEPPH